MQAIPTKTLYIALFISLVLAFVLYQWEQKNSFERSTASTSHSTGILFKVTEAVPTK